MQATREEAPYTPHYQRFIVKKPNYERQYSHIYTKRLNALLPSIKKAAKSKWGSRCEDKGRTIDCWVGAMMVHVSHTIVFLVYQLCLRQNWVMRWFGGITLAFTPRCLCATTFSRRQ